MKISRIVLTVFTLALLLIMTGAPEGKAQAPFTGSQPALTLLSDGVRLEWQLPAPQLAIKDNGNIEVLMAGFMTELKPGAARLPWVSFLVALPHQANPVLEIQSMNTAAQALERPLAINIGEISSTDLQVVSSSTPLFMEEIGTMRGIRLARVMLRPAWQAGNQLMYATNLSATIRFGSKAFQHPVNDPLAQMVQSMVINPTQAESRLPTIQAPAAPIAQNPTAVIEVSKAGIYQVTYEQLAAAGFPVTLVNPVNLKLSHAGLEIPYEWTASQDTVFSPGETLRFFAQPVFSRWSTKDTYFLTEGSTPGKLIQPRNAAVLPGMTPANAWADVVFEDNQIYTPDCLCGAIPSGRDGDRWVWTHLDQPGKATDWFELITPNVSPSQPATITLWWIGKTEAALTPDHLVQVSLNGNLLGVASWDGKTAYQVTLAIPAGVLVSGSNIVSFDMPGLPGVVADGIWLDAMQVHYILGSQVMSAGIGFTGSGPAAHTYSVQLDSTAGLVAYDVTDPLNPTSLYGYTQQANRITIGDATGNPAPVYRIDNTSSILTPPVVRLQRSLLTANETGADELILLADGYEPSLAPLVSLRTGQGLKIASENLQSIFDQFSFGRLDPEAIRSYLRMTYLNWTVKPRYVLLVGDGTVDPKHYRSDSSNTIAPAMLKDVDPFVVESAADNRYVTLDSAIDLLPDMIIGRLPANTPAEATAMVAKITQYETQPVPGLWHGQTMFIADDIDSGGDFAAISERDAQLIPGPYFAPEKLFFKVNIADPAQMHPQIVAGWNRGVSMIVYTGHASIHFWAVEQFLHINQLGELANGQKLPVVLDMTCFTGSFQTAGYQTLDESLVRKPDGGAIAAWGSTSQGISTGHEYLAQGFIESLVGQPHFGQLGEAALAGKLRLAISDPQNQYLVDSFTLFGDPAGRILVKFVPDHINWLPVVNR